MKRINNDTWWRTGNVEASNEKGSPAFMWERQVGGLR